MSLDVKVDLVAMCVEMRNAEFRELEYAWLRYFAPVNRALAVRFLSAVSNFESDASHSVMEKAPPASISWEIVAFASPF